MRYTCDDCDARASEPEGTTPAGWHVEFALDLCPSCSEAADRGEPGRWERRLEDLAPPRGERLYEAERLVAEADRIQAGGDID